MIRVARGGVGGTCLPDYRSASGALEQPILSFFTTLSFYDSCIAATAASFLPSPSGCIPGAGLRGLRGRGIREVRCAAGVGADGLKLALSSAGLIKVIKVTPGAGRGPALRW